MVYERPKDTLGGHGAALRDSSCEGHDCRTGEPLGRSLAPAPRGYGVLCRAAACSRNPAAPQSRDPRGTAAGREWAGAGPCRQRSQLGPGTGTRGEGKESRSKGRAEGSKAASGKAGGKSELEETGKAPLGAGAGGGRGSAVRQRDCEFTWTARDRPGGERALRQ